MTLGTCQSKKNEVAFFFKQWGEKIKRKIIEWSEMLKLNYKECINSDFQNNYFPNLPSQKHLKKWQVLHLQIVSLPIPLYLKKTFNKVVYKIPLLAHKRFESTALEPLKQQGS